MTDLERVRDLLSLHSKAWGDTVYTDCLDIIDAHLKEDAERESRRAALIKQWSIEWDERDAKVKQLQAELARLREEAELFKATEWRPCIEENARLREELEDYKQAAGAEAEIADEFKAQRDTLLAALRNGVGILTRNLGDADPDIRSVIDLMTTAISEVEGEK